jgi:hypothetical protein
MLYKDAVAELLEWKKIWRPGFPPGSFVALRDDGSCGFFYQRYRGAFSPNREDMEALDWETVP